MSFTARQRAIPDVQTINLLRYLYRKFKPPFFSGLSHIAGTGELSISFLSDEIRSFASVGLGGAAVGGALSIPDRTARSNSERAVPSVCVGNRFRFLKSFGIDRNRCAGARGGAWVDKPRWLRILTITGGASIAAMIFKAPPQFGQCSMSMSKTRLSSLAQLKRAGVLCACA
jgi:hypothetical protein